MTSYYFPSRVSSLLSLRTRHLLLIYHPLSPHLFALIHQLLTANTPRSFFPVACGPFHRLELTRLPLSFPLSWTFSVNRSCFLHLTVVKIVVLTIVLPPPFLLGYRKVLPNPLPLSCVSLPSGGATFLIYPRLFPSFPPYPTHTTPTSPFT